MSGRIPTQHLGHSINRGNDPADYPVSIRQNEFRAITQTSRPVSNAPPPNQTLRAGHSDLPQYGGHDNASYVHNKNKR
jgi:hypothetical protein